MSVNIMSPLFYVPPTVGFGDAPAEVMQDQLVDLQTFALKEQIKNLRQTRRWAAISALSSVVIATVWVATFVSRKRKGKL